MTYRLTLAAVLLALLTNTVSAASLRVRIPVTYAAPAGDLPVGPLHGAAFDAVLPSGRIVTPTGTSAVTGMNALGFALSPDGRYAIVSNDDERTASVHSLLDPSATSGFSLAVIDATSLQVVDRYSAPGERYWVGIAALDDPAHPGRTLVLASGSTSDCVYVFTLDANGRLAPDPRHTIALPGALDPTIAGRRRGLPATIAVAPDGRRAYVVDDGADSVSAIDIATRRVSGSTWPVGFFPFGAAIAGDRLLVSDEGSMRSSRLSAPALAPPFGTPPPDLDRASSLSLLPLDARGDLGGPSSLPMDPPPDGVRMVGGAHPTAIVTTPDGAYAFVAMTNVDRIATVQLGAAPHFVGGTELRLFDRGPYGTQPAALALSRDGSRLYVALAGLNAVAVIDAHDPVHLHRLGLIATGWYPTALALGADDHTLYVLDTKGFGHDASLGGDPVAGTDASAVWSTFEKIDLSAVRLTGATQTALADTRRVVAGRPAYPPGIANVVVIEEEAPGFDAMLGDLGAPYGDPSLVEYPAGVTPNLHALARSYALAVNLFADAEDSGGGHQFLTAGTTTVYEERTLARHDGVGQDPEEYPRLGYIFDSLERHHVAFRDYGDLLGVSGYDGGHAADPLADDPAFAGVDDVSAPTQGLGGLYAQDVPALAALGGHVDLQYPGWNLRIRDERRAHEFIRDYTALVASGRQPRYTQIWLPDDATGSGPQIPSPAEEIADGDRALGEIVAYLTHLRSWRHTVIVIVAVGAAGARDHVDPSRSYALVVSPFAKRHYFEKRHLSTVSVLKTSEELLGLGTLSLGDLLATDMSDCFAARIGNAAPYTARPVPPQPATAQ